MGGVELVIFDMAGTTVRDDGQVPEAFTAALAEYGVGVSPEVIRALRGASKREAIQGLLPKGAAVDHRADGFGRRVLREHRGAGPGRFPRPGGLRGGHQRRTAS